MTDGSCMEIVIIALCLQSCAEASVSISMDGTGVECSIDSGQTDEISRGTVDLPEAAMSLGSMSLSPRNGTFVSRTTLYRWRRL